MVIVQYTERHIMYTLGGSAGVKNYAPVSVFQNNVITHF